MISELRKLKRKSLFLFCFLTCSRHWFFAFNSRDDSYMRSRFDLLSLVYIYMAWNINDVVRRSDHGASRKNRICTVKCEIGALSASRRVHNFNDFRAGTFGVTCFARRRRRSKVDANQTPWFEISIGMIGRAGMESMTRHVIIKRSDDDGCRSRNDICCRRLCHVFPYHIKGNLFTYEYIAVWNDARIYTLSSIMSKCTAIS